MEAGSSLESLMSLFNTRITDLKELVIARNMYPASSVADLSSVDTALKSMELQVQQIKQRLHEEALAIPKAKKLIEASLRQQTRLKNMSAHIPPLLQENMTVMNNTHNIRGFNLKPLTNSLETGIQCLSIEEDHAVPPKAYRFKQGTQGIVRSQIDGQGRRNE